MIPGDYGLGSGRNFRSFPQVLNPMRVATVNNVFHGGTLAMDAGLQWSSHYWPHIVAADLTHITLAVDNWSSNSALGEVPSPWDYTVEGAGLIVNGVSLQMKYNGSNSRLINSGATKIEADERPATDFGVPFIPKGSIIWSKMLTSSAVGRTLFGSRRTGYFPAGQSQCKWFNPANTIPSAITQPGAFTFTGTNPVDKDFGLEPIIGGRFMNDGLATMLVGDSMGFGEIDDINMPFGKGWYRRSLMTPDLSQPRYPGICFANPSAKYLSVQGNLWKAYLPWINTFIDQFGINNKGDSVASVKGSQAALYTAVRAAGVKKIGRTQFTPHTTSTDNYLTKDNQSYVALYGGPGQFIDQMNQHHLTLLANGTIDFLIPGDAVRDPTDPFKFKTNGVTPKLVNADDLHYNGNGNALMAAEARPILDTVAAQL